MNVSSIAALDPLAGSGLYAAAKSALSALSDELAPLGVGVTMVEPGAFRTNFLSANSIRVTTPTIDDYTPTNGTGARPLRQARRSAGR